MEQLSADWKKAFENLQEHVDKNPFRVCVDHNSFLNYAFKSMNILDKKSINFYFKYFMFSILTSACLGLDLRNLGYS